MMAVMQNPDGIPYLLHMNKKSIDCLTCSSRCHSIFSDIGKGHLEIINGQKGHRLHKKGEPIFYEGNPVFGIYVVHKGKVKITQLGSNGNELIVALASTGEVLGYQQLLSHSHYDCTAIPLVDSSICFIPADEIFRLIEEDSNFAKTLLKKTSADLQHMTLRLTDSNQKSVRQRMASTLLKLHSIFGFRSDSIILDIELSREEMANIALTTPESCMRVLSAFKKEGIIEVDKREIGLLKISYLEKIAQN